jgi:hypothetical protein
MLQQGQVFELATRGRDGKRLWAYRLPSGGTRLEACSAQWLPERGGRARRAGASVGEAPARAPRGETAHARRVRRRVPRSARGLAGDAREAALPAPPAARPGRDLGMADDSVAWLPLEATQALRQVLARAVVWGILDVNPAKHGVENPQRRGTEKRPFESWEELEAVADRLGPRLGPMVIFAAATGMRPGEWVALERRDIDRNARVAYVRRSFSKGRLTYPKTEASIRAVPPRCVRLRRLTSYPQTAAPICSSPRSAAAATTSTTSETAPGNRPRSPSGSSPSAASTISSTHSRPSPCVPASPPRALALHGRQPDHDRSPLRPPRPRWTISPLTTTCARTPRRSMKGSPRAACPAAAE